MSTSGVSRTEAHAKRSRKTPAERRAELVEAAALVFLEKGYEAATVVDITGRASSSHGTFYVYFDSKEEIFDAVAQDRVMVLFDAVNVCAGQSDRPAIERIRDILKINSGPELTGWWVEEFSRSNMTHLRERLIHKALETFLPVLTDLLREAVFEGSIEVPFPEATSAFLIAGGLIQRFGLEATGGVTLEQWTMAYDDFAERVLGLRGLDETTHPRLR
jgi:AcrR family transcriptional regulator